jgi:hypothetical protein
MATLSEPVMQWFALAIVLVVAVHGSAQDAAKAYPWLYGQNLKVRNVGAKNFDATTPKVGIEVFHDTVGNALVAISEAGHLAVMPYAAPGDSKKADWLTAFEIRVRPAGEAKFTGAKTFAAESFKDMASGKLLTVSNVKSIAVGDLAGKPETGKDPEWHHALELKVRAVGQDSFASAKVIGIEAYKDGLTGGLVYASETGFLAFAPAPATAPVAEAIKAPKGLHGLTLQTRKADEGNFTKDTKAWAIEAFLDPNSGATLYISETGSIAAAVLPEAKKGQGVAWSHAFRPYARKADESSIEKAAKYGVEVFQDKNTGAFLYISETGSIAIKK